MITLALSKGRIFEDTLPLLAAAGTAMAAGDAVTTPFADSVPVLPIDCAPAARLAAAVMSAAAIRLESI